MAVGLEISFEDATPHVPARSEIDTQDTPEVLASPLVAGSKTSDPRSDFIWDDDRPPADTYAALGARLAATGEVLRAAGGFGLIQISPKNGPTSTTIHCAAFPFQQRVIPGPKPNCLPGTCRV